MTDEQVIETSRTVATGLLALCREKGFDEDDAAAAIAGALMEALGQLLGPIGAVERMRDVADICELQFLRGDPGA